MMALDDSFATLDLSWFDADPAPAPASMSPVEQRRLRRKISNRESARRCRMRKQRHLEDLCAEWSRLRSQNRHLAHRVVALTHRCLLLRRANDRLRAESAALRRKFAELRRLVQLRQVLMVSPPRHGYEQALASLIA